MNDLDCLDMSLSHAIADNDHLKRMLAEEKRRNLALEQLMETRNREIADVHADMTREIQRLKTECGEKVRSLEAELEEKRKIFGAIVSSLKIDVAEARNWVKDIRAMSSELWVRVEADKLLKQWSERQE